MTGCHTNTATSPLSACHEAAVWVKILPIQADLSWSTLPHVPLCTAAFSFFFSSYYILLPFCLFGLNRHLPLLALETHSLRACLSLNPSNNRVLSLTIALDMRLFLLILRQLSSTLLQLLLVCHMAILVNPARGILFAHCTFDVALSPPRFPAHWLPFASLPIRLLSYFGFGLLAAVWEDFFSIWSHFKRALLFVFFPRPSPNHPILWLAHLFRPLLLPRFRWSFPYYNSRSVILSTVF